MSLDTLITKAREGVFPGVALIVGSERLLSERAVSAIRAACLDEGVAGFNSDQFQGASLTAQTVINAARTLPMMARTRFVMVRAVDAMAPAEQEALAAYLRAPSPDACMVLLSDKLDGRGKLAAAARECGCFYEAVAPKLQDLPALTQHEARGRGHPIDYQAALALVDALGADLAAIDDALERLSLYVGAAQPIDLAAVEQCVVHARVESVWALVDAVGARNAKVALAAAASLLGKQEPPLKILGLVARQLRIVARMRSALRSGLKPQEAAQKAGAPGFKARDLAVSAKRFDDAQMARAFRTLAEADLQLKGSKVPGPRVLEQALLDLCR
ncbi:MAG: DNA polymerase III subunit delta [Polyangiales bacterium]